jgi:hypothetical protein
MMCHMDTHCATYYSDDKNNNIRLNVIIYNGYYFGSMYDYSSGAILQL